jgi:integrase
MYSKSVSRKASGGSVQIKVSNGRLQLVFTYAGERKYLSLGLRDSPATRKVAEAKAKLMESDIVYERFDSTLEKYRVKSAPRAVTPIFTPIAAPKLKEIWAQYQKFQTNQVSASTLLRDYERKMALPLKDCPYTVTDAVDVRDWLLKRYSSEVVRRMINKLSACCKWAKASGLIEENSFEAIKGQIKKVKGEGDRTPFTVEERETIFTALESNTYSSPFSPTPHSFYLSYVKFLFLTGCRPEEAAALRWKHIQGDCERIRFEVAIPSDTRIEGETKTHKVRTFPCNGRLQEFLRSLKSEKTGRDERVFPAARGGVLDTHNFSNRVWKPVVEALVELGIVEQYLSQYHARHTFITLMLEAGVDAKDVAKWVGNSPEVIYRHYAGSKRNLEVPEV